MSKEIFVALSGGLAYQRQLETVSNNLANVSTVGFKEDRPVFSVAQPDRKALGLDQYKPGSPGHLLAHSFASLPESYINLNGGALRQTGGPLDLALQSEGFFAVRGENGDTLYTRDGQFRVNNEGLLVNSANLPVLGDKGEIKISSPNIRIDASGNVSVDDQIVDRLRIESFDQAAQLEKIGSTLFTANAGGVRMDDPEVIQGALEQSNTDPIRGMVELINVQRNFESFTKVVSSIDDLDQKVNSRLKI